MREAIERKLAGQSYSLPDVSDAPGHANGQRRGKPFFSKGDPCYENIQHVTDIVRPLLVDAQTHTHTYLRCVSRFKF
jgi:hypothetical protein